MHHAVGNQHVLDLAGEVEAAQGELVGSEVCLVAGFIRLGNRLLLGYPVEPDGDAGEQGQHDEREKAVAATVHRGLCMSCGRAKDIR